MATIKITELQEQEADRVAGILAALDVKGKIFVYKRSYSEFKFNKRMDIILQCMTSEPKTQRQCYLQARKNGYPMKSRTFQRDIEKLANGGLINKQVLRGGNRGNTTILSKS